jgi:protein-tyrosine phosphatase
MTDESPARFLHLPSGHNFRDVGGYATSEGRRVKWRQVFRSGYMSKIAGDDIARLHELGIDTILDLRANDERAERPTVWHHTTATELWARDHDFSSGSLGELALRPDLMPEHSREGMVEIYRTLPHEQVESYRELFTRMAQGRLPILYNCSAGKDRTGLASALLLALLGVDEATIEADYMLSNEAIEGLIDFMANSPKYAGLVRQLENALPMLRVEPEYLATSMAVIARDHGTVERYLAEVLGVDAKMQAAIRDQLLD